MLSTNHSRSSRGSTPVSHGFQGGIFDEAGLGWVQISLSAVGSLSKVNRHLFMLPQEKSNNSEE